MKKINIYLLIVFVGMALISACSDDFLEELPKGSLDESTLGNEEGVEASLIAAYSLLDGWGGELSAGARWSTNGMLYILGGIASDDALKGSGVPNLANIQAIEFYNWSPLNPDFDVKFKALYDGIARSNATLKLLKKVEGISPVVVDRIEGEARFLRGHYHFNCYKIWGNIPYYTEEDENFRKPNNVDVIPILLAEFQEAVDLLPEVQVDVGRVTKGVARAYLGKVFLYNKQYSEAKQQFDMLVGKYELMNCYHDVFNIDTENDSENMFGIQYSVNDGSNGANAQFDLFLNHPHSGSPFGCCGGNQVSHNLVNAYKVDDNGLPFLDTFNDVDIDPTTDVVDPRLDWNVGRDDVPYLDWGIHDPSWIRNREFAGPYSGKKYKQHEADPAEEGGTPREDALNVPLLRYADVLLMLAEAEVELGDLNRALELVNMIRARAGACAQGAGTDEASIVTYDLNDPAITWATYKVGLYPSFPDQDFARKAVRFERRLEFGMEGMRLFDLRRWGIAKQVLNDYIAVESTRRPYLLNAFPFEDKHSLYPLPSVQIELSKVDGVPQLVQNPGY